VWKSSARCNARVHSARFIDRIAYQAMNTFPIAPRVILTALLALAPAFLAAQDGSTLTWQQKEEFLKTAKVTNRKGVSKGTTGTQRLTLTDGTITHDAQMQRINESKISMSLGGRTVLNFRDYYGFNVAAWRLARLLGIGDMVPVSVERGGAAYTWWTEDIVMDETKRLAEHSEGPNPDAFRREREIVEVFDHLIYNWDRNQGNFIYDSKMRVWMIDHTRSFRLEKTLLPEKQLHRCDRKLLAAMKALTEDVLRKEFGKLVSRSEVQSLLARRDLIVRFFEERGEAVLFDRPAR
jgi:hypothetical protein